MKLRAMSLILCFVYPTFRPLPLFSSTQEGVTLRRAVVCLVFGGQEQKKKKKQFVSQINNNLNWTNQLTPHSPLVSFELS
jgi:hypothetical protein